MRKSTPFVLVTLLVFLALALPGATAGELNYWAKLYGGESYDSPWAVAVAPNGDVVIGGYTQNFGAGDGDAWILRLDKNGAVRWQKTCGGGMWDEVEGLAVSPDGDIVAAGWTRSFGEADHALLLRLDGDGNVKWQRIYGEKYAYYANAVALTPDGDIVVAGSTNSPSRGGTTDVWVARLDPDGNIRWQKVYGGRDNDVAWAVAVAPNGDIVVAGGTTNFGAGYYDFWVLRLDPEGNLKWGKAYGKEDFDEAYSIAIAPDGGIIVGGVSEGDSFNDALIMKLDGNGSVEWAKALGVEGYDNDATSLVITKDGDVIVSGSYLFLLSPDGKLKWAKRGYWNFASDPDVIAWTDMKMAPDGSVALVAPGTDGLVVARFDVATASAYSGKEGWHDAGLKIHDAHPAVTPASGPAGEGTAGAGEVGCEVHDTSVNLKTIWKPSTSSSTTSTTPKQSQTGEESTNPPQSQTGGGSGICGPGFVGLLALVPLAVRRKGHRD